MTPPLIQSHYARWSFGPGIGAFMEVRRPPGEHAIAPAEKLLLIEAISPGIRTRKRWGRSRFNGIAPVRSLWLHPTHTRIEATFETPHALRVLAISPAFIAETLGVVPNLDRLFDAPFLEQGISASLATLWRATAVAPDTALLARDHHLGALVAGLERAAGRTPEPIRGGLSGQHARRVTEMIADGAEGTLRLATLASAVGLSPFHFARAFKRTLGVSPHRFQKLVRVQRAVDLLRDGRLSVLQVALGVGYSSSQALARVFRQELGLAPDALRAAGRTSIESAHDRSRRDEGILGD